MNAAQAIAALDRQLANREIVTVRRGATSVAVRAKVEHIKNDDVRTGSTATTQPVYHLILSPTGLQSLLPLVKATDKVVARGAERAIMTLDPIQFGTQTVRIELDVQG